MQATRTILWDIYEEHLDEAGFLWGQWETSLASANYTRDEVATGPEERLLAHLDGLVLGGRPVADRLLLPAIADEALADEDPGKLTAATWALLEAEDADYFDAIIAAFRKAAPQGQLAMGRALRRGLRPDLAKRTIALDPAGDPVLGAIILDIAAARDLPWTTAQLTRALTSPDAPLLAAALRAARRAPNFAYAGHVAPALQSRDETVRAQAIQTAFIMGLPGVLEMCRREAARTDEACRLPLAILAMNPQERPLVLSRLATPAARRHALWALGFAGDAAAIEVLLPALGDEATARVAGDSISMITGLVIAGALAKPGVTVGPTDTPEVDDDDAPPVVLPEDHLPIPRAEAITTWWKKSRDHFQEGVRYLHGQPHSVPAARAALDRVPMWRRRAMCLEIAAGSRAPVPVDTTTWARAQRVS